MSLSALVLRNLTVLALTDRTLAAKEVRSSLLEPINEIDAGEAVPVIAVFTDRAKAEQNDIQGLDIVAANTTVTLAIEIACMSQAPTMDKNGVETFIPQTDEGMEMTLDITERQAIAELQAGTSEWSELWRKFACKVVRLSSERGAAVEKGVRFAGRRIEIDLEPIAAPTPGAELPHLWQEVLAAFAADNRVKKLVPLLTAAAKGGADIVEAWLQVKNALGLSREAADAVGIGPMAGGEAVDATVLTVDDVGSGLALSVDEGGASITDADGNETGIVE